jgi:hypothetical protein
LIVEGNYLRILGRGVHHKMCCVGRVRTSGSKTVWIRERVGVEVSQEATAKGN